MSSPASMTQMLGHGILDATAFASSNIGAPLKDTNGNVRAMSFQQAAKFCQADGGRLPSPREFTEFATKLGAQPLRESSFAGLSMRDVKVQAEIDHNLAQGFYAYEEISSSAGLVIAFYMNPKGYRTSSSREAVDYWTKTPGVLFAAQNGFGVVLGPFMDASLAGVRCTK